MSINMGAVGRAFVGGTLVGAAATTASFALREAKNDKSNLQVGVLVAAALATMGAGMATTLIGGSLIGGLKGATAVAASAAFFGAAALAGSPMLIALSGE